jgi:hypothetical protein
VVAWPDRRFLSKSNSRAIQSKTKNPVKGKTTKAKVKNAKPKPKTGPVVLLKQPGPLGRKMVSFNSDRNEVAHEVRHDLDYDSRKRDHEITDRVKRKDQVKDIPINEYAAFVIDPEQYHPSTPYVETSQATSVVSFKFQTTGTCSPDSSGGLSFGVQLGQASDNSGAVVFGGLLPNLNAGAPVGKEYANFQITDPGSGINVNKNIFINGAPTYPSEASFKSFSTTMEKHFSAIRLIAARLSVTPLAPSLSRDGIMYGCSCPKGGSDELGPNNTDPTEANFVNMPKIFSCPGMKTMPMSDGDTMSIMWYPKDSDSFELIPSRQAFSSADWKRKYRSGAMLILATGMSSFQSFLVDYELFFQATPSNATFNITGSSLSLANPIKQADAMNLFLTNSNVHMTRPTKDLFQNFETRDVNVAPGRTLMFHEVIVNKPSKFIENYITLKEIEKGENLLDPQPNKTTYGRAMAFSVSKPGGSSSGSAIGRKIVEVVKKSIPLIEVVDSFISTFF